MRDDVKQLLALQNTDQKIQALEAELVRIPQLQEAAKDRLANDTQALATAKSNFQANEIEIKNVELDVGTRKNTIDRLKNQQFETKKNDEYTKLGEEVVRYENEVDELETRELELMETADDLRSRITDAEEKLAKTQGLVDEEIAELQARLNDRKAGLTDTNTTREDLVTQVDDEDLLDTYNRLYNKRESQAVVRVTSERSCTSCHVQVTPATYALAQSGTAIAYCDNCSAILFP
ncbi:MAG: C4-type zinc ribbon domain-containing protein [Akkermansiaceae bacterium]|nr:C4-type zinc ribbon domain-containing protein [Akkermansiaceae bacterium]